MYPNQFVKLKVLSSHIKNEQEIIEDVAVIKPVSDEKATKELLKSKGDELVYHTIHKNIVLVIRQDVGLRRFHKCQAERRKDFIINGLYVQKKKAKG